MIRDIPLLFDNKTHFEEDREMSKRATIFWFFVTFIAIAFLSATLMQTRKAVVHQMLEIMRMNDAIVQLSAKAYDAEPRSFHHLEKANYCMELPISADSAIIWQTGQELKGRHYLLLKDPPPDFFLQYWQKESIRTLPW